MIKIQSQMSMSRKARLFHYLRMLLGHCQVQLAFIGPLEATDIKFGLKVHMKNISQDSFKRHNPALKKHISVN